MTEVGRVRRLVDQALDEFDSPGSTVSMLLRRCIRIATLRNDYRSLLWLQKESLNADTQRAESRRNSLQLQAHFDRDEWERLCKADFESYLDRRRVGEDAIDPRSVSELEENLKMIEANRDSLVVPEGLAPIDLYYRSDDIGKAKMTLTETALPIQQRLERIRQRLHVFLVETERQLEYGQINADIFERTRRSVDEHLAKVSPEALAGFISAYKRVREGDPESLSHALTSCRRVLKSVADAVYPATNKMITGSDGKERALTDDKYVNRLLQAVSETLGKHGQGEVLTAVIGDLAKRLASLNGLASKGVHDAVTADEVDTCVVQTYLLVGDVLKVVGGRSALEDAFEKEAFVVLDEDVVRT
ncbi:MAG TPA: hypothetical protein VIW24_28420 [Aldersonia sp.]